MICRLYLLNLRHEIDHTAINTATIYRRPTVSGVSRGEQRKIYDQRRATILPHHGINLVIISYTDFGSTKRLIRNHDRDVEIVRNILK